MKIKYPALSLFLFLSIFSFSQKKIQVYKFHSVNNLSLLNGDNEVSAGLQTVNGIQRGNWFGGIGVGLDYYLYRSVPLFADVHYEFGKSKNKFFAYADGGVNFEWVEQNYYSGPVYMDVAYDPGDFHNGIYTDAGLGYLVTNKKGGGLVLSLGHTHKSLKQTISYQDWRTQEIFTDIYRYNLNRIVVKVGWKF